MIEHFFQNKDNLHRLSIIVLYYNAISNLGYSLKIGTLINHISFYCYKMNLTKDHIYEHI